jgi:hypothetical protein
MASVLLENNISEVHYMSVDVEGAEEQVVSGIDFQKTFLHLISFEANYPESATKLQKKLEGMGFSRLETNCFDIFMFNSKSPFFAHMDQAPPHEKKTGFV